MPTLNVPLRRTRWRRLRLGLLSLTLAGPLAVACSGEDGEKDGAPIQDASAGSGGASKDAQPERGSGGGSGMRDTGSEMSPRCGRLDRHGGGGCVRQWAS